MKKQHRKSIKRFIEAASSFTASKGVPAEVEGDSVKCAVVFGENGYDVTLWCEPGPRGFTASA